VLPRSVLVWWDRRFASHGEGGGPDAVQEAPAAPALGRRVPVLPARPTLAPLSRGRARRGQRQRRARLRVLVGLLITVLLLVGGERRAAGTPAAPPRDAGDAVAAGGARGRGAARARGGGGVSRDRGGQEGQEGQLLGAAAAAAPPRRVAPEGRLLARALQVGHGEERRRHRRCAAQASAGGLMRARAGTRLCSAVCTLL
jgi:hypothetical protein